ncbi:MAG: DUF4396 domain-containing protein [Rhodospirillales bacterium]|nr:DUF4396 domain-containing protein [Rhodospirillales bacterium]
MLNGVMLLWFLLTAAAIIFVAVDIRTTPESPVLKWGFVLLTAYTGPVGAFLYVLGCREPLSGLHERYVSVRWRQVLGSTMHCVAGDGVGILAGAAIASLLTLPYFIDIGLEYVLGFGFGWTIFQALFMRGTSGGSYRRSLARTVIPEFLSMNLLMTGMVSIAAIGRALIAERLSPVTPDFWFVMSMALLTGFAVAFPINWWLVAKGLKHGMMTVRTGASSEEHHNRIDFAPATGGSRAPGMGASHGHEAGHGLPPSPGQIAGMAALSVTAFGLAIWFTLALGGG